MELRAGVESPSKLQMRFESRSIRLFFPDRLAAGCGFRVYKRLTTAWAWNPGQLAWIKYVFASRLISSDELFLALWFFFSFFFQTGGGEEQERLRIRSWNPRFCNYVLVWVTEFMVPSVLIRFDRQYISTKKGFYKVFLRQTRIFSSSNMYVLISNKKAWRNKDFLIFWKLLNTFVWLFYIRLIIK